eukprot:symbB.v1.2.000580.t1/scaffold3.1/size669525/20
MDVVCIQEVNMDEFELQQFRQHSQRNGYRCWGNKGKTQTTLVKATLAAHMLHQHSSAEGDILAIVMSNMVLANVYQTHEGLAEGGLRTELTELQNSMPKDWSMVFVGDFNELVGDGMPQHLDMNPNYVREKDTGEASPSRWSGNRCIDWILTSSNLAVDEVHYGHEVFGDHKVLKFRNAFINGKYSVFKTLFHGRHRWEKEKTQDSQERVVIFFSAPLHRWKICGRFDDTAPVFAYAPVSDFGHSWPSGADVKWFVSTDRKDHANHAHDPEVRFVEEEAPAETKKNKVSSKNGDDKVEDDQLQVAELHHKQLWEHFLIAKGMQSPDSATAVVVQGRAYSKKNHQINGVYLQRAGKFHGALCYQKITTETGGQRYLLYSATKQAWRIADKIQDQHCFAYAKVEDRGATSPGDLPAGYLLWKVYQNREAGYVKDDEAVKPVADADDDEPELVGVVLSPSLSTGTKKDRTRTKAPPGLIISDEEATPKEQPKPVSGLKSGPPGSPGVELVPSPEVSKPKGRPSLDSKPAVKVVVTTLEETAWPKRKACAKMLVKSGLRCSGCFRLKSQGYCTCSDEEG